MTFEQQLVHAIQQGCPECGSQNIYIFQEQKMTSKLTFTGARIIYEPRPPDEVQPYEVWCESCGTNLWLYGAGWHSDLQEDVKEARSKRSSDE